MSVRYTALLQVLGELEDLPIVVSVLSGRRVASITGTVIEKPNFRDSKLSKDGPCLEAKLRQCQHDAACSLEPKSQRAKGAKQRSALVATDVAKRTTIGAGCEHLRIARLGS